MASKYGWWTAHIECKLEGQEVMFDDLSECSQEHICKEILGGCRQGLICEEEDDETNIPT